MMPGTRNSLTFLEETTFPFIPLLLIWQKKCIIINIIFYPAQFSLPAESNMSWTEYSRQRKFNLGLQGRLVLGFLIAAFLTGMVASAVGMHLINKNTIAEVHRKIEHNIKTAQLIYEQSLERLSHQVGLIALCLEKSGFSVTDSTGHAWKQCVPGFSGDDDVPLDMMVVTDASRRMIYAAWNPMNDDSFVLDDSIVRACIKEDRTVAGTILMPIEQVITENPNLADRVKIRLIETPQSAAIEGHYLAEAMVLRAAVPFHDEDGRISGAVVGSRLINKDNRIVDRIVETVYENERYRGLNLGYATIFQGGVRVSTNVMSHDGVRAIGTIVSDEVYTTVLKEGKQWTGRAFVVNDWYISSYVPIISFEKKVVGMLYTGILEAKYRDMKRSSMLILFSVTSVGAAVAFLLSWMLGRTIIKRIRLLKEATDAIAAGNLDYKVQTGNISGLGILDEAFNNMTASLKDRDERLKKVFQQMAKTERLAALGQIAAGVAHEINNPLGGIVLYSNLILEDLPEENKRERENVEKIIYQANRCRQIVQNLLDFSRSPSGEMMPVQMNNVIHTALGLVKDQYMFLGIDIKTDLADNLPEVMGDQSRLEQVFLNLFINAADAMGGKGTLTITTKLLQRYASHDQSVEGMETEKICLLTSTNTVKITITDTGRGIDEAYLPHIFEPFFSTKEPGRGTGLGLSITYGIIKKHEGFIDVESTPGVGTTVTIYLPALE